MKLQFNIKTWMLVVVIWALPNALLGWLIRANPAGFPHPGIQVWQICVGWNIVFAFFGMLGLYYHLMVRYLTRGMTTAQIRARNKVIRSSPSSYVFQVLNFLLFIFWFNRRFFRDHGLPFSLLATFLLVAVVAELVRSEVRKRPTRRDWTPASLALLTSRILLIAWIGGTGFLFFVYDPHLGQWGFGPSFPIPPSFLLIMFGVAALGSLSVVSMRRVEQEDKTKAGQLPPD